MPKDIYKHNQKSGPKPSCFCGTCTKCRQREHYRKKKLGLTKSYRDRRVSSAELDHKLNEKFKALGWD